MKKLLLISIGALLSISIFSQDVKNLYLFEFEDESEYVGELISDSPDKVTVKRMDGSVVNIPAYKIIRRTKIDEGQWDENAQELIFPNLHDTRYFFSPSAFSLKKGEGCNVGLKFNISRNPLSFNILIKFKFWCFFEFLLQ